MSTNIIDDRYSIIDDPEEMGESYIRKHIYGIHTAHPAVVVFYDAKTSSADIKLLIMRDMRGVAKSVSKIIGVPVQFPRSLDSLITFPIKEGTTGLAVFCESSIDRWLQNTDSSKTAFNPLDTRMHDYSDAIFFPGVLPYSKASADPDKMVIASGEASVSLDPSGSISIEASGEELLSILKSSLDKINPFVQGALTDEIIKLQKMITGVNIST